MACAVFGGFVWMADNHSLRHTWVTRPFRVMRIPLRHGWRRGKKVLRYARRQYITRPRRATAAFIATCWRILRPALVMGTISLIVLVWPTFLFWTAPQFALGITVAGALLGALFIPSSYREYQAKGCQTYDARLKALGVVPGGMLTAHYVVFIIAICTLP